MLFSSQLSLKNLIEFCRVLRHSLGAGLSIRNVFRQQAEKGAPAVRPIAGRISEEIEKGESLESALLLERRYFPAMFVSMATSRRARSARRQDLDISPGGSVACSTAAALGFVLPKPTSVALGFVLPKRGVASSWPGLSRPSTS